MRLDLDLALNPNFVADAHCLPFRDDSVDEIYCSHLLEHLRNPILAVKEVMRVLKPKGHGVFIVPNIHFPWTIYVMYRYGTRRSPYEVHRWRTDQGALNAVLKRVGFIVSEPLPLRDEEKHWGVEYLLFGSKFDLFGQGLRFAMMKIKWVDALIKHIDARAYVNLDSSPETKVRAAKPKTIDRSNSRTENRAVYKKPVGDGGE